MAIFSYAVPRISLAMLFFYKTTVPHELLNNAGDGHGKRNLKTIKKGD